jgi:chaperone required for assembly of F1-ATPase
MSSLVNRPMKRFYKTAEAVPVGEGLHGVHLDGRPIRTPSKAALAVPFAALADAIAEEWNAQEETLVLDSMPLTQLANSALDRVIPLRDTMIEEVMRFADTELLCYRAAADEASLAARQAETWQPLLDWARQRYDAALCATDGLMPVEQPEDALRALRSAVMELDDWRLTALQAAAAPLGSLILALALLEGRLDAEAAYRAAFLDELYQMEHWGADAEAQARLDRQRKDIADTARFLALLGS